MGKTEKYDHMKLIGALASVSFVGVSLFFFFDWRMVLASFWVIPTAFIIVVTCSGAEKRAVLIIAHRMRTIANADHIVVLKDGVVAEEGSPEMLSATDSIYSRMTKQQLIAQNWKM